MYFPAWLKTLAVFVLKGLVGIFWGVLLGIAGGLATTFTLKWLTFPGASFNIWDILAGLVLGAYLGGLIGLLIGLIDRGWRSGIPAGVAASAVVMWVLFRQPVGLLYQRRWYFFVIVMLVWTAMGWLTGIMTPAMLRQVRSPRRGFLPIFSTVALILFYGIVILLLLRPQPWIGIS